MENAKKWLIWILLGASLVWLGNKFINWLKTPSQQLSVEESLEVSDDEWIKGSATARATLVEYSDFQCPACGAYYPVVKSLLEEYPDDLRVVYRHFPLTSIHPSALPAALATEAAGKQGGFWEMHDMLFEKQEEWSGGGAREKFVEYAEEIGLDTAKFEEAMDLPETKEAVSKDMITGNSLKIRGTPTFFLNGQKLENPAGLEPFRALIEAEIK